MIKSGKSYSYWLARFNRKMSFHFPWVVPLISDQSVWHNGKQPRWSPFCCIFSRVTSADFKKIHWCCLASKLVWRFRNEIFHFATPMKPNQAISEFRSVSLSKRVLVWNFCYGNYLQFQYQWKLIFIADFALSHALKWRQNWTRKWPVCLVESSKLNRGCCQEVDLCCQYSRNSQIELDVMLFVWFLRCSATCGGHPTNLHMRTTCKYVNSPTHATVFNVQPNLVPRVSLLCLP